MGEIEQLAGEVGEAMRQLIVRVGGAGGEAGAEERTRALRRDAKRIPGRTHFASVLAYGNFELEDGPGIRCEAIPGISGVTALGEVQALESGQPQIALQRVLTHFHFDAPAVAIEQHYARPSTGTLTGARADGLLPGRATFEQYLILTLDGRPLANPEPLVMTADRVEEWPPIGSTFVSERPTAFVDLAKLEKTDTKPVAHLVACKAVMVSDIDPVLPDDHQRVVLS